MSAEQPPALAVRHLSKRFAGARALDDVELTIAAGEVHGLLGENGSGKSTLIKILAGYHDPDPGAELEVRGEPVKLPLESGEFRELGLSFVHQDLGLVPGLSVVENLIIGDLASSRNRGYISWRRERQRARQVFRQFNLELDPRATVDELVPIDRALLAIVRAVVELRELTDDGHPGILVLDEPTVFLPKTGTDRLFALIRNIAAEGASVLFVSHDLTEVMQITDRITVLRDGRNHGTVATRETTETELIEMIVGRRLVAEITRHRPSQSGEDAYAYASDLAGRIIQSASFELHEHEILGVTGLAGSGLEELPYLLFGALPGARGSLRLGAETYSLAELTPYRAMRAGMALVPADRRDDGAYPDLNVQDNILGPYLHTYFRHGVLASRRMRTDAGALLRRFDVRPPDPRRTYGELSGGNQQNALLAKWLQRRPALLLLHEPTRCGHRRSRRDLPAHPAGSSRRQRRDLRQLRLRAARHDL